MEYILRLLAENIRLRQEIIRLKQYVLELDRELQTGESHDQIQHDPHQ